MSPSVRYQTNSLHSGRLGLVMNPFPDSSSSLRKAMHPSKCAEHSSKSGNGYTQTRGLSTSDDIMGRIENDDTWESSIRVAFHGASERTAVSIYSRTVLLHIVVDVLTVSRAKVLGGLYIPNFAYVC
ncbi:hypothetical protein ABKN59_004160 [Abortiporus biennis]